MDTLTQDAQAADMTLAAEPLTEAATAAVSAPAVETAAPVAESPAPETAADAPPPEALNMLLEGLAEEAAPQEATETPAQTTAPPPRGPDGRFIARPAPADTATAQETVTLATGHDASALASTPAQQAQQFEVTQRQQQQQLEQSLALGQQAICNYLTHRAADADHPARMKAVHAYCQQPANVQQFVATYQPHQWAAAIQLLYDAVQTAPRADGGVTTAAQQARAGRHARSRPALAAL